MRFTLKLSSLGHGYGVSIPSIVTAWPGGGDGGHSGGGGYPEWWYSMWDFVNWVNSIQIEKVTVTVKPLED